MINRILQIALIILVTITASFGQVISDALIEQELKKKGLERSEVEAAMMAKGIDVNTVDINNPVEVAKAKKALEEVIAELEAKKKNKGVSDISSSNTSITTDQTQSNSNRSNVSDEIQTYDNPGSDAIVEEAATVTEVSKQAKGEVINDDAVLEAVEEGATVAEAVSEIVQEAKASKLPEAIIYGHHLYRQKNIKFYEKSSDAKPPANYIIGPGDGIAIEIWGVSEGSFAFRVNQEGYIKPDRMPRISLVGLTIAEAKDLLKNRFSRYYRFTENTFEVNISTARTINVNISGEVFNSGNYNVSALNNAINALVAAGGPTNIGSVRNIKLIQSGETKTIDLYQYLLNPSIEQNYYLAENDYIVVPVAQKIVEIKGAINRPYKYELLGEEGLRDLIDLAAGLKVNAYTKNISVKRILNNEEVIIDVNLAEVLDNRLSFELYNGDVIVINQIPNQYRNIVNINGAVELPGEYAYTEGMTIADLINLGTPKETAILNRAYLVRLNADLKTVKYEIIDLTSALDDPSSKENILLQRGDRLEIRSGQQFTETYTFSVEGAVRNPGEYRLDNDDLRLSDAIFLSNGLTVNALDFGYLLRKEPGQDVADYIFVDIKSAVEDPQGSANISLQPQDRLVIYDNNLFDETYEISVSGAVKQPGSFPFSTNLKISDLILLANGLTPNALDFGFLLRKELGADVAEYIAIDVMEAIENPNGPANIELQPQDQLVIYNKNLFSEAFEVNVGGAVKSPGTFAYSNNMTVSDLIKRAGGVQFNADLTQIDIFRVEFVNNKKTRTLIANVKLDENLEVMSGEKLEVRPFDEIIVRTVPEFELQRFVSVLGELTYPGKYALIKENMRVSELIDLAGGITDEAFIHGAGFTRSRDGVGNIIIDVEKALDKPGSEFDIILQAGDVLTIPKQQNLVSISGAIKASEVYSAEKLQNGQLNMPFLSGKSAKYYINEYAGGFHEKADKDQLVVEYATGELKRTKRFLFFRNYPDVKPGAKISVPYKKEKPKEIKAEGQQDSDVDWGEVLASSVAQATAVLSLILLVRSLD